jgi:predicted DNA-binding WGR domain protein
MELKTASLYFRSGSSDKEYHARIEEAEGGFVVNFAYGRRGSNLSTGTKTQTQTPVDYAQAAALFGKLVKEKARKGYTPGAGYPPIFDPDELAALCRVTRSLGKLPEAELWEELYRLLGDPEMNRFPLELLHTMCGGLD